MWIKVWITIFVLGFAYGKNFDTCPDGPPDYCEQGINCFLPDCVCSGTEPDVPLKVEIWDFGHRPKRPCPHESPRSRPYPALLIISG
mgnify:CR=1 FL=1